MAVVWIWRLLAGEKCPQEVDHEGDECEEDWSDQQPKGYQGYNGQGSRMLNMSPHALHCTRLARPAFSSTTPKIPPPKSAIQLKDSFN